MDTTPRPLPSTSNGIESSSKSEVNEVTSQGIKGASTKTPSTKSVEFRSTVSKLGRITSTSTAKEVTSQSKTTESTSKTSSTAGFSSKSEVKVETSLGTTQAASNHQRSNSKGQKSSSSVDVDYSSSLQASKEADRRALAKVIIDKYFSKKAKEFLMSYKGNNGKKLTEDEIDGLVAKVMHRMKKDGLNLIISTLEVQIQQMH